jgi:hypothetical protein
MEYKERTMMKLMKAFAIFTAVLAGMSLAAPAEDMDARKSIQKKLESEYLLTKTTADKTDIVTPGSVLTLKKDKFVMTAASSSQMCGNSYRDGKLAQNAGCKANAMLGKFSMLGHGADKAAATRTFVNGEKFWITKLEVRDAGKDSGVYMEFFSDAINDVRFHSSLMVGFKDGLLPSPEDALALVREVVTPVPPDNAKPEEKRPEAPPPAENAPSAIAPPPPPPDAPAAEPPTVALGQTPDQVVAILGPPLRKAKIGTKEIYSYKDLKVTFLNGKVKDIQ